jgi:RND family efflux transporter MFP subunit
MADATNRINELRIDRSAPAERSLALPWILVFVLLLAVAATIWWLVGSAGAGAVSVVTETARQPSAGAGTASVLDASGYVVARRQATVSSKITGKVEEVLVEEGMRVEKGQVVARLDDSTEQAQLDLAISRADAARAALAETRAQLTNARLSRDRLVDLAERELASRSSVDAAVATFDELAARLATGERNVEVAERNVALARDALSNTIIRAPFAGMVVTKNAQPGEMISPVSAGSGFTRTGICTIIDTDSLEIEVDVNEAYIQRVAAGQRVSAVLDAYPEWRIPAEVIAIIPTADRQRATVRVRIAFLEKDTRILRDMGAKVAFLGSEPAERSVEVQGVLVSQAGLRTDAEGDYVWLVRNGAVSRRSVTISGDKDRDRVLVSSGLASGDVYVVSADGPLTNGQPVKLE